MSAKPKDALCDSCEKPITDGQKWLSLPALPGFVSVNGWADREIYHVTCAKQIAGVADSNGVFVND